MQPNELDINTPDYWDLTYEKERERHQSRIDINRYNIILGHIKDDACVMDFGCGTGEFLKWLKAKKPNTTLVGVDYSPYAIKIAKEECPENNYFENDCIKGEALYDVITIQHVLEHFHNPEAYLEQAYKALKDDGILILVFPCHDQVWREHLKVWTLDFLRLFMRQQKQWRWIFIYRPDVGCKHNNGEPIEEALVICQKILKN